MSQPIVQMVGGAASPLRVLGPGADPANPDFQDIIFDGNQQPLRVKQKGTVTLGQGPGFYSGIGAYGGQPVPISNPKPGKRHLAIALGNVGSSIAATRQTPGMSGNQLTGGSSYGAFTYFQNNGIGVATDETQVWCLNNFGSVPVLGNIGTLWIWIDGFPEGHYIQVGVIGITGFQARSATVSYLVFHNTIG